MPTYDDIERLSNLIAEDKAIGEWLRTSIGPSLADTLLIPGNPGIYVPRDAVCEMVTRHRAAIRDELHRAGFNPPPVAVDRDPG